LSGGLASATSTWLAALAVTFLTEMLLIFGLDPAWQYIVYGAAIIVGMVVSGDRIASFLGRVLRRIDASAGAHREVTENTSGGRLRKGATMEGRKEWGVVSRKRRWNIGAATLLVLGAALGLAIVSASSGSTGHKQTQAAKPAAVISTGKGYGEVYAAK